MHLRSLYPPIPPIPDKNVEEILWNFPGQEAYPEDFTLHVDAITGRKRSRKEFYERFRDASTALGAPVSQAPPGGDPLSSVIEEVISLLSGLLGGLGSGSILRARDITAA